MGVTSAKKKFVDMICISEFACISTHGERKEKILKIESFFFNVSKILLLSRPNSITTFYNPFISMMVRDNFMAQRNRKKYFSNSVASLILECQNSLEKQAENSCQTSRQA